MYQDGAKSALPSSIGETATTIDPNTSTTGSEPTADKPFAFDISKCTTPSLVKDLQDHHNSKEEDIFLNQLFDCMVCFATKPGAKSIQFPGFYALQKILTQVTIFHPS